MDIMQKLTSRKMWAAIAGIIVGLVVAFGGEGETIEKVSGSVMSVVSAVVYILTEGFVDAASAGAPMKVENLHIDGETGEGAVENDAESN